ncbi:hypothetical protein TREMEDRAFT_65824 [Tremella mesenterica DSM 1558]|uniref:uncharacterized protein n=1 Tax=Tremella mesenterica (strain ATCC 24925 / CBS 8224 / DSM 1558 / NBRC 9311 / NRRL Y-6157 / RJB 2259-6 / UBC 559-6) TaxID=578456 RepID=UPI00032D04BA|nr:uncharacterized protein TREMEDRAFT_65824 [Tremella mesenterica DSM 1558]EIW66216.1 hypothetical protein TREMEDRAFT_65824 [Tremella mesenterica DSM 1558]
MTGRTMTRIRHTSARLTYAFTKTGTRCNHAYYIVEYCPNDMANAAQTSSRTNGLLFPRRISYPEVDAWMNRLRLHQELEPLEYYLNKLLEMGKGVVPLSRFVGAFSRTLGWGKSLRIRFDSRDQTILHNASEVS